VAGKISNPFVISRGVRQRDGLSATLFNLVLHKALKNLEQSNMILNSLTQICEYADDILVTASSFPDKTKYMRFSASPSRRSVKGATINGVTYEGVAEFIYLGTLISNDNSVEKGIKDVFWPAIELILPL